MGLETIHGGMTDNKPNQKQANNQNIELQGRNAIEIFHF